MATVMASRFSVLKIEDDSDQEREKAAKKKAAEEEKNKKKLTKKKKKNKPSEPALDAELQSMAFGLPKPKNPPKQRKPPNDSPKKSEVDWQEWEKRDQVLVDDTFEKDLQQAMMLSKVDFERQSSLVADADVREPPKQKAKKAKTNILSVDQLQSLSTSQIDQRDYGHLQPPAAAAASASGRPAAAATAAAGDGADFFDQVERRTREAVCREKAIETIKQDRAPSAATPSDAELRLRLATKESEVDELQLELERTRDELKLAKARTKRVLGVLTQSETKEKVQLIVSLEKAQAACETADRERAEMSAQVTALLAQLEQERSRVHVLTTQLKRAQSNRRRGQSENEAADSAE